MAQILNGKIPTKVKIEVTLDIDRDLWVEAMAVVNPNALLNKAVAGLSVISTLPSADIFSDQDRPVITAIILEDNDAAAG